MTKKEPIVIWSTESKEDQPYSKTTWFRCMKVEEFVRKISETDKIMGVVFEGNNIGFILDEIIDPEKPLPGEE